MAEGARLESVFRGNSNVGSNPTLSASNPADPTTTLAILAGDSGCAQTLANRIEFESHKCFAHEEMLTLAAPLQRSGQRAGGH